MMIKKKAAKYKKKEISSIPGTVSRLGGGCTQWSILNGVSAASLGKCLSIASIKSYIGYHKSNHGSVT